MSESQGHAEPERIEAFVNRIGEIGRDRRGGWSRLAFTKEERDAHDVFAESARDLGLSVRADAIGNTFATLRGDENDRPMYMSGSHLDSVPNGGNFDGVAGVATALEVGRILSLSKTFAGEYCAVAFTAEESARFGAPCIGSRVAIGEFTAETLRALRDQEGTSLHDAAADLGLRPDDVDAEVWPTGFVELFLELHIEQGAVLDSRGRRLGLVDAIGGSTRLELSFPGTAAHSGATPMSLRRDALVAASEFVIEVERQAARHPTAVATVGRLDVEPGSLTTVPGFVRLSLDTRDIDSDRQRDLAEDLLDAAWRIAGRRGITVSASLISDQSPVTLHRLVREDLARTAESLAVPFAVLPSGATHDTAHIAKRAPAGMLFVSRCFMWCLMIVATRCASCLRCLAWLSRHSSPPE